MLAAARLVIWMTLLIGVGCWCGMVLSMWVLCGVRLAGLGLGMVLVGGLLSSLRILLVFATRIVRLLWTSWRYLVDTGEAIGFGSVTIGCRILVVLCVAAWSFDCKVVLIMTAVCARVVTIWPWVKNCRCTVVLFGGALSMMRLRLVTLVSSFLRVWGHGMLTFLVRT